LSVNLVQSVVEIALRTNNNLHSYAEMSE